MDSSSWLSSCALPWRFFSWCHWEDNVRRPYPKLPIKVAAIQPSAISIILLSIGRKMPPLLWSGIIIEGEEKDCFLHFGKKTKKILSISFNVVLPLISLQIKEVWRLSFLLSDTVLVRWNLGSLFSLFFFSIRCIIRAYIAWHVSKLLVLVSSRSVSRYRIWDSCHVYERSPFFFFLSSFSVVFNILSFLLSPCLVLSCLVFFFCCPLPRLGPISLILG